MAVSNSSPHLKIAALGLHCIFSFSFSFLHSQKGEAAEDKECAFQLCHRVLLHQEARLHERAQPRGQHPGHVQPPQLRAPVHSRRICQRAGEAPPGDVTRTPQGGKTELFKTKGKLHLKCPLGKTPPPFFSLVALTIFMPNCQNKPNWVFYTTDCPLRLFLFLFLSKNSIVSSLKAMWKMYLMLFIHNSLCNMYYWAMLGCRHAWARANWCQNRHDPFSPRTYTLVGKKNINRVHKVRSQLH